MKTRFGRSFFLFVFPLQIVAMKTRSGDVCQESHRSRCSLVTLGSFGPGSSTRSALVFVCKMEKQQHLP